MTPPTILIVGATGNTGFPLTTYLPSLLPRTNTLRHYRILALTRNQASPSAQELAKLPGVETAEHNWTELDDTWLRSQNVKRIFIASHNEPSQFAEEGQFLGNALRAGVGYVVRISTTAANVKPDHPAYYPRTHWAIEQMLDQPEFEAMKWTSLQPNIFFNFVLPGAVEVIKEFKKTGKQIPLALMIAEDVPVGLIDPGDVGILAAHLLAQDDVAEYNRARLVLNGPGDVTGAQVAEMVEERIGAKIEKVTYRDVGFVERMAEQVPQAKNLIRSVRFAPVTAWEGLCKAETTSKEVLGLAAPRTTAAQALDALLAGS
ncbi:hypothetical protein LTR62_006048 [Meristemomyces frigidus]|uniref:NmrA-like domain-containing protein n=1 Tax=Meristemomyces frigidus TaxID=1508187 RepID=A0AAN7YN54_9PEZI|nr:hypothetical protein LTR62_006048 [Meristemomyces frigidus]